MYKPALDMHAELRNERENHRDPYGQLQDTEVEQLLTELERVPFKTMRNGLEGSQELVPQPV
jgi:hypothetical protein